MRVKLDCEAKYLVEEDPWGIGAADSERYDLYVRTIRERARLHGSILDVGCGVGAMLARLREDFTELHGVELSSEAILKGRERHPFIDFEQGSIATLDRTDAHVRRFDCIVFSDVLYYVEEAEKRAVLRWIADHLNPNGFAFIAAYSPGSGGYPSAGEVVELVEREFVVESHSVLDSEHVMIIARPRRRLAALTLDYETWQPVPAGRRIDWEADVFAPTSALLDACDAEEARLTIFAELGEHAYLREHEPELAARMEEQWREAVRRGHDVQMHLHPAWLPELGARREEGGYVWDETVRHAEQHPELSELVGRLKRTLEQAIRPAAADYEVVAFRAGAYEAQPFRGLASALLANGLWCDSSVYAGGRRRGLSHDYAHPLDSHQPWFASFSDPQLKAPPAESAIVELPVTTFGHNDRWMFDAEEGARFGTRLLQAIERERAGGHRAELTRAGEKARQLAGSAYDLARSQRLVVNRLLPRALAQQLVGYPSERRVQDDFYVAVGHSKADLDVAAIRAQLRTLREQGVQVIGLAELARIAREQLASSVPGDPAEEALSQVRRERAAVLGTERNEAQSLRLQAMIPLDRERVLDLGCGAGTWSARIAAAQPWMHVTGVDAGEEFIEAARERHGSERVDFAVGDFLRLPFPDGSFDCVYADNSLEHAFDVDATLAEALRVLSDGGTLLAAIPPDARNPGRTTDNHTWRTFATDVRERLEHAGFRDVSIEELDTYRLGAAPYPPAEDRMLYVRAWRRAAPLTALARADELRHWTHERLDPSRPASSSDPVQVLHEGHAYCAGMTLVLGEALTREGYAPRWVTMVAFDHPRGRGPHLADTHETIELTLPDRSVHVLDPMADVRFPCALAELIAEPTRSDEVERERDRVYLERGYDLYATSFWYRRVVAVAVRDRIRGAQRFVPVRWADRAGELPWQLLAAARGWAWQTIRRRLR